MTVQNHKPVLLKEAIDALSIKERGKYIDATVGVGGHTREILKRGGRVLAIDQDPVAIRILKARIKKEEIKRRRAQNEQGEKLILVKGNFRNLKKIAQKTGFLKVAGILFDLGLSSWQIEKSGRGFSYLKDEPLDMRMDPDLNLTAADLINNLTKEALYEVLTKFGEEVHSRAIANAIVGARPIKTTGQLVEVIREVVAEGRRKSQAVSLEKLNPCLSRVFQALRIAVNKEISNLNRALPQAIELLEKKGRLVVISFHSLEDRVVKFGFKGENLRVITKAPIRPSREEIRINPRARSAKLRLAERI